MPINNFSATSIVQWNPGEDGQPTTKMRPPRASTSPIDKEKERERGSLLKVRDQFKKNPLLLLPDNQLWEKATLMSGENISGPELRLAAQIRKFGGNLDRQNGPDSIEREKNMFFFHGSVWSLSSERVGCVHLLLGEEWRQGYQINSSYKKTSPVIRERLAIHL